MKDNIKRVMERGENLEHLDEKAGQYLLLRAVLLMLDSQEVI